MDSVDVKRAGYRSTIKQSYVATVLEYWIWLPLILLSTLLSSFSRFEDIFFIEINHIAVWFVLRQELTELAISIYKNIGRYRAAKYLGMDLAQFYS